MTRFLEPDLCIIGAGSGGLSVAAGAAQMGASVVLCEAHKMGGDCLNVGCVPSKSLLAAAHHAQAMRAGRPFGIRAIEPEIDLAAVLGHVAGVIASIAPHDSVERFRQLGCTVIEARARFTDPRTVEAGGYTIQARRFVVATGSSPAVPPIPGLKDIPFLTNETVFQPRARPGHLIVIGGGPIGCELAQAHRRLGAAVTLVDIGPIMPKDDPELVEIVRRQLLAEGIVLHERVKVLRAEPGPALVIERAGREETIRGTELLVAAGRKPNSANLGLDEAGIRHGPRGIEVDARLRTSNRKVYAIGDVAGGLQLTHVAGWHAGILIRNALFRLPAKADPRAIPWVTYTDPELAQVGLAQAEAERSGIPHRVLSWSFAENDRAQAERRTEGRIKVVVSPKGHILGAAICGLHAGELIAPWVLAMTQKLRIGAMAGVVFPYPTLGEVSKRAAGSFYTPKLFSERTRWLVRLLARLG